MSNDDLGLSDLSPNIIDDWERWASDRPDRQTKQDANERKIIALCRAVRQLRKNYEELFACAQVLVDQRSDERDAAEQWRVEVAEALGYLNRVEGQSGYEVAGPRVIIAAFRRIEGERDAARENHLKVMKQRDAAFSLLDSFRNAHVQEHRWGAGVCHLCLAAEKLTKP